MAFIDKISAELTAAMRARDSVRLGTLRMAKAALMNREVERGRALDDAESHQVIAALIKQRRDSIEQFRNGGREDLADKEEAEIAILEAYLPPPMDAAELERLVREAITETDATSPKDMGRVMKGGDGDVRGQSGRRKGRQRAGEEASSPAAEKTANLCEGVPSNHFERHAQPLIHPPSGSCRKAGAFFFSRRFAFATAIVRSLRPDSAPFAANRRLSMCKACKSSA